MAEGIFWARIPDEGLSSDGLALDSAAEQFVSDLRVSFCNEVFAVSHGFVNAEACIGTPLLDLFPNSRLALHYMQTLLASGRIVQSIPLPSGSRLLMISHLVQESGKIRGIQGINIEQDSDGDSSAALPDDDVQDSSLSKRLLLQSIEDSKECMVLADLTGTIIYANSAKAKLMGLSKEELVGTNLSSFGIPGQEELEREMEFATLTNGTWTGRLLRRRSDGKLVPVHMRTSLIRDHDGQPIAQIRTFTDVSEQADLEAKLSVQSDSLRSLIAEQADDISQKEEGFRVLYENSPIASIVTELDGTICEANPAACALLCAERDELLRRDLATSFWKTRQWSDYAKRLSSAGKAAEQEIEYHLGDGSTVVVCQSSVMLRAETEDSVLVHFLQDITEAKRLEKEADSVRQQMTQADRLASIGQLVAGVAHELNNPLTGVLTFSHMLRKDADDSSQEAEDLDTIIEAAGRCREIVRGLLDFSRHGESDMKRCDLGGVLREALSLVGNQALVKSARIREQIEPDLPMLIMDPRQIQQVVVNLVCNAIDAVDEEGTVTVRAAARDDDRVEVQIEDTGCGISEADLKRIYDPFFTTKPAGEGTGLGLAVVYGIVQQHGGSIEVTSRVGQGSTFTIKLPVERAE